MTDGGANLRLALVVDDSMLIRHTVSRFLEGRGFRVLSAVNGADGFLIALEQNPSLIVTDLDMPGMGGKELIAALRADPRTKATPIIIVAGRRSASGLGLEELVRFVIYKDIDLESQLSSAIDSIFGREQQPS